MTKALKPVSATPTGIATALKREGLDRSQSFSTAVRGYRSTTVGFKVQKPVLLSSKAIATVSYVGKSFGGAEGALEKALTEYARVLTENGFRPERTAYDGTPKEDGFYLTVYERSDAQS